MLDRGVAATTTRMTATVAAATTMEVAASPTTCEIWATRVLELWMRWRWTTSICGYRYCRPSRPQCLQA